MRKLIAILFGVASLLGITASTAFAASPTSYEPYDPPTCNLVSKVYKTAENHEIMVSENGIVIVLATIARSAPPYYFVAQKSYEGRRVKFLSSGPFQVQADRATLLVYEDSHACQHDIELKLERNNTSYQIVTTTQLMSLYLGNYEAPIGDCEPVNTMTDFKVPTDVLINDNIAIIIGSSQPGYYDYRALKFGGTTIVLPHFVGFVYQYQNTEACAFGVRNIFSADFHGIRYLSISYLESIGSAVWLAPTPQ